MNLLDGNRPAPGAPWARLRACSLLLLLAGSLGAQDQRAPERMQMERQAPDYRFRLRAEYRAPGQRRMALALRGGSAKGLAHLGILQGLDAENLAASAITGTSAGSLMGSLYASGFSGEGIARIFRSQDFGQALDDRRREPGWSFSEDELAHASLFSFAFRDGQLDLLPGGIRSRRMRMALMPLLGRAAWLAAGNFDRLRMPLRVVTTDLTDGRGAVFASGSLVDVVMASTCLPGIFAPVEINGHQMVDGGPFENLPVMASREAFPDMAQIGVAIGRPWNREAKRNVLTLMDAALDMAMAQTEIQSRAAADLIIRPDMKASEEFDFYGQVDAMVGVGRMAFDGQREALERVIYGPGAEGVVASGLELEAPGIPEASPWIQGLLGQALGGPLNRRQLWRVLRRAHGDLPIAGAEIVLPADPGSPARLRLIPAPIIQRIELDLPAGWRPASRARILRELEALHGIAPGRPFHEGAWGRAMEEMLAEAVLAHVPILDLQGSGLQPDGTLRLQAREPVLRSIRSQDPEFAPRLERFLEPLRHKPIRTPNLEETLARASTRLGLARLAPDLRENQGDLDLALDPQKAPSLEIQPLLAYESSWGGHLGIDVSSPDFLNTGTQLHLHGAMNDLQTRVQGHVAGVFRSLPSVSVGLAGGSLRHWFPDATHATAGKIAQESYGLRIQGRFGMEDRGLLQIDLGQAHGRSWNPGPDGGEGTENRASSIKAGFEWDSFDYHTLPTDGLLTRISYARAFHAQSGPTFTEGYLRVRRIFPRFGPTASPLGVDLGLDLDLELALQDGAPRERWFIAGGSDSIIGSRSASYLAPNMGILRVGFPFTAATMFGVAIQAVPRFDYGKIAADYRKLGSGVGVHAYGLVLRGALRGLYLELAGGETRAHDPATGQPLRDRYLGFLIGSRPFDLWKGR